MRTVAVRRTKARLPYLNVEHVLGHIIQKYRGYICSYRLVLTRACLVSVPPQSWVSDVLGGVYYSSFQFM